MPFKNVEYLDDLFTWAEAEGLLDEPADDQDETEPYGWDGDLGDEEVKA